VSPTVSDLPSLFAAADSSAITGQRRYLRATAIRLALTIVAAVFAASAAAGIHGEVNWSAFVAALAFIAALCLEAALARWKLETDWYDGRAIAESVKTIAWRFAVGGLPYEVARPDAEDRFVEELEMLPGDSVGVTIVSAPGMVLTPWMRRLRESPLEVRKATYLVDRIGQQREWYEGKAAANRRGAARLRRLLILLEVSGAAAALGMAFGWPHFDLAGILSAAVGAGAAWLAVKQHDSLWSAYSQAAYELSAVRESLVGITDELAWAAAVADAEEAVSREHTMWRARRLVSS
jgi:hypothetical protein